MPQGVDRFDTHSRRPELENMTVDLAKDVEDFLREQVQTGVCADASELVNDLLRSVRAQQAKPFEATGPLEAWLLESADKPVATLVGQDFAEIRKRVRERSQAPGK